MLIFNIIGLGLFAGAALIAGLFGVLLGKFDWFPPFEKPAAMVVTGVFMIVLDLWFRMKCGEGSLLHPRRGGHFFFVPLWLLGGGWTLLNLCGMLAGKPEVSARESYPSAQTTVSQPSSYPASLPSYANSSQMPSARLLKLGMLSGVGTHRIATINGQPFAEGESRRLTVGPSKVMVQCTEIHEQSVVVQISGDSHSHELQLGRPLLVNRQ